MRRHVFLTGRLLPACASVLLLVTPAAAQTPAGPPGAPATTMASHPEDSRWWISGQLNLIEQAHGPFRSPYQGPNSLQPVGEQALSRVWTIYTGVAVSDRTELFFDLESAGGGGISEAVGLAGFTNLDVVRNPGLGATPYVARVLIRHVIPLSGRAVDVSRGPLELANREPARRLELWAGRLSLMDFFDINGPGSDSHLQFMNWTVDNNGAYDYAADTRGYTYAVLAELITPRWTLRGAEALMPKVANGLVLDWNVARARSDNLELEIHPTASLISRTLVYVNHANMGNYAQAIADFRAGMGATPDVVATRRQGRRTYGIGENLERPIGAHARLFGRVGWNDGRNESFAYTEVNNTVELGADLTGNAWRRAGDRFGLAAVSNGLSASHREYLQLGGLGFMLGDGTLRYGRETILESYYTAHLWRGLFGSVDGQYIVNPGYNRDRGPVFVSSVRLHVDF